MVDVQQLRVTQAAVDAAYPPPSGAWADAPDVADTDEDMTNDSGYRVTAYVIANGATITAIKVNGVTTGRTAGAIILKNGDTLTLTYTVATPAIAWIYG